MRVMVTGGTGTVGSAVVRALLGRGGVEVAVLTRGGGKPVPEGTQAVVGDLGDPAAVRSVFKGATTPSSSSTPSRRARRTRGCWASTARATAGCGASSTSRCTTPTRRLTSPISAASCRSKSRSRPPASNTPCSPSKLLPERLLVPGRDAAVRRLPAAAGRRRPLARGRPDIADAAAVALTTDGHGHSGETYDLVGPDVVTGPSTAATWIEVLGREVRYGGDDLDAWEEQNLRYLPPALAYDFRMMYEFFQREGLKASGEALARLERVLGPPPRSVADFARETAAGWKAPA